MQQLIYFFRKFKYFLFFLLLQCIALTLIFTNLNFHKSKYVTSANAVTGSFYNYTFSISEYFSLKKTNHELLVENTLLRNRLEQKQKTTFLTDSTLIDTIKYFQKYTFSNARIINNNFTKAFNYLTLNKGIHDSIRKEMAVVNGKGIIGITETVSLNYTRVQSVLNKNSKLNARLKNSGYFGSLKWDGQDYRILQLTDIPRQAVVKIGDTIETDGKSTIFPEGILIGIVVGVDNNNAADNAIDVRLFNDMSSVGPVYIIKNLHKYEIKELENTINE
ncbi:putative rod shape-determining protein MreC [Polaribacter irgensii 23-P]|jgi:rod shape-determining protein MreC|uniref:Cell shape-determining protein MreC n=1 Tax=Polaribacter irgensii 23-P TaxID=313594 RepID=A4BYC2_9FLAO|nr:rod shape-determining protein MreC [Polaribacter irgensii]EAR13963.1 putative rod shape-determining protein MreC [Polaribacter irgensii 23-P]